MRINMVLDYCRFTVAYESLIVDFLPDTMGEVTLPQDTKLRPFPPYSEAYKLRFGRVDFSPLRPEQKRMVTLTGEDLRQMREANITQTHLIQRITEPGGANMTRLDFAIDLVDTGITASHVYDLWQSGKVSTSARKVELRQTYDLTDPSNPASTVYFGARQSVKMVRVYDKGLANESLLDWLRIEIETKAEAANILAARMVELGFYKAGISAIKTVFDCSEGWFIEATEGATAIDMSIGRKETNHDKWLREIVLPSAEKAIMTDATNARRWLAAMWAKYEHLTG